MISRYTGKNGGEAAIGLSVADLDLEAGTCHSEQFNNPRRTT